MQVYSFYLTFAVCIISHEYHFDQYNDSFNVSKQKIYVFYYLYYVTVTFFFSSRQILLFAFLKVIEEGSHMVMMECPDTVNTLLHEFFLWEPDMSKTGSAKCAAETKAKTTNDTVQTLRVNKTVDK